MVGLISKTLTLLTLEVSETFLPECCTTLLVLNIIPVPWPYIASMVGPLTKFCLYSDISNSSKTISYLLCYVGVKKVFLFAKILVVFLGGKGVPSVQ